MFMGMWKKVLEPVIGMMKDVSRDITKTLTETSKENSKALECLNNKLLDTMNDTGIRAPKLMVSLSEITSVE